MLTGTFRRNVGKTQSPKAAKMAFRMVSKNTVRMQIAQSVVALKGHTGQLLRLTNSYLLGLPQTQEMKDDAFVTLGDIGYDLTALARVLKVKQPSTMKRAKLVGTRGAAILQLDGLTTDLLQQAEKGLFTSPKMTTTTKMVTLPQKGGAKEERDVAVVNLAAEQAAEQERQAQMKSLVSSAMDLYWRLCFDMTGQAPATIFDAKVARLQQEYPAITFDTETPKSKVAVAVGKAKKVKTPKPKAQEPVPA